METAETTAAPQAEVAEVDLDAQAAADEHQFLVDKGLVLDSEGEPEKAARRSPGSLTRAEVQARLRGEEVTGVEGEEELEAEEEEEPQALGGIAISDSELEAVAQHLGINLEQPNPAEHGFRRREEGRQSRRIQELESERAELLDVVRLVREQMRSGAPAAAAEAEPTELTPESFFADPDSAVGQRLKPLTEEVQALKTEIQRLQGQETMRKLERAEENWERGNPGYGYRLQAARHLIAQNLRSLGADDNYIGQFLQRRELGLVNHARELRSSYMAIADNDASRWVGAAGMPLRQHAVAEVGPAPDPALRPTARRPDSRFAAARVAQRSSVAGTIGRGSAAEDEGLEAIIARPPGQNSRARQILAKHGQSGLFRYLEELDRRASFERGG
jgi:hypothetical protein